MRYFFINYSVPKRIHHAVYHLKALSAKHWGKKRHCQNSDIQDVHVPRFSQ